METFVVHHPIKKGGKVLLFCHGFPGTNRMPRLASSLPQDISLVEINYRGDKMSKGRFSFFGCSEDILKVTEHIKNQYASPVYALGYSAGGLYTLNVAIKHPKLFKGILLVNPLVDTDFLVSSRWMEELWQHAGKILSLENRDFYQKEIKTLHEKNNPMNFADGITTPIWLVQSSEDEVLPPKTAQEFFSKLKCQKQWISISNRKHDLDGSEPELMIAPFLVT